MSKYFKILFLPIFSLIFITGCPKVTTTTENVPGIKNHTFIVEGGYDETWEKLLQSLVLKEWQIIASSKEGGIITTGERSWNATSLITPDYSNVFLRKRYIDGVHQPGDDRIRMYGDDGPEPYACGLPDYQGKCFYAKKHKIRYSFVLKREGENRTAITVSPSIKSKAQYYKAGWCYGIVGSNWYRNAPDKGDWGKTSYEKTKACNTQDHISWPISWAGLEVVQ